MELLKRLYKISSKSGMEDRIKSFVLDCVSDVNLKIDTDDIVYKQLRTGMVFLFPAVSYLATGVAITKHRGYALRCTRA